MKPATSRRAVPCASSRPVRHLYGSFRPAQLLLNPTRGHEFLTNSWPHDAASRTSLASCWSALPRSAARCFRARNCFFCRNDSVKAAFILVASTLVAGVCFAQSDAVPAFKEVDSMEARVQGCVTCHGQSGQGTNNDYFPRIAGKPAGYLYNQLVAFRDGTRHYPPMNYLVAYLPDSYLREIAEHFAKQRPPFAPRTGRIVRCQEHDARAGSRDCRRSAKGRSGLHHMPWRGSHRDGAWHSGSRRAAANLHRCPTHPLAGRRPACRGARLHEAHRNAAVRYGHHRGCRLAVAAGHRPKTPRPNRPTSCACRWHAAANDEPHPANPPRARPPWPSVAVGVVLWMLPGELPINPNAPAAANRNDAGHQSRGIPGPRRGLRRLPHHADWQGVRWRPGHGDPVRSAVRSEHHAGRRDRHRQVDRG